MLTGNDGVVLRMVWGFSFWFCLFVGIFWVAHRPNVNSHFGIMDLSGFWKDRTHWYASWFPNFNEEAKPVSHVHAFPHWDWNDGDTVDIWAFSNAATVQLEVNGKVVGAPAKQAMPQYGHVTWSKVPFASGSYTVTGYDASGAVVGTKTVASTTAPATIKASIKDGVGATLYAGCGDMALVQVEVLDAAGNLISDPDNALSPNVTFTVSGTATAWVEGTGNGDPSCLVNNKSPTRPAYHGLALALIGSGDATGTITVTASAAGMKPSSTTIVVKAQDTTAADFNTKWCIQEPKW